MPIEVTAARITSLLTSKMPMQREAGAKLLAEVARSETLRKRADIAALLRTVNGKDTQLVSGKPVPVKYGEEETKLRQSLRTTLNSVRSDVAIGVQNALKHARERKDADENKAAAATME